MDITRAINHALLNKMIADTELTDTMENSNIRVGIGVRSDDFPYIVYDVDISVAKDTPLVGTGKLEMHLWDKNPLTTRINEMRGKVIKLLDCIELTLSGGEAKGVRIFWDNSGKIADITEHIQHVVLLFTIKLIRSGDINY